MKLLKKFAIGVLALLAVLALIVFIAEASFHRIGSQKLNEVSAQLDTEEPGWKLDQIEAVRQAAKPADDANPSIAVLELHAKIGAWWPRHRSSEDGSFGIPTNRQPAFSQLCWLLAARLETRDLRNAARERLLKPEYLARAGGYYPIEMKENPIVTLLPHAEKARAMASLLDYDARISTMEGDPERGIRSARAGLVVAKSIGDEPFLISQLVRIACAKVAAQSALQVLAWSEPKQGLAELQAELLAEANFPWLLTGLRGERGMIDKLFQGLESGAITFRDLGGLGGDGEGSMKKFAFKLYKGLLPGDHAKALELLSAYIAAAKLPPTEQVAAVKAIPLPPRPPEDFRYMVALMIVPATAKVAEASIRIRADLLAASAAIACERFRIANGRWPTSLAEIPKAILPEVPTDPYDGQPLRFRRFEDGIAVYSVGDGKEETVMRRRGNGDPLSHIGQGWKLWSPEHRGLPAEIPLEIPRP